MFQHGNIAAFVQAGMEYSYNLIEGLGDETSVRKQTQLHHNQNNSKPCYSNILGISIRGRGLRFFDSCSCTMFRHCF